MDVEEQLVVAVWEAFVEFLANPAVGWTHVVGDHVSKYHMHVEHLGQLVGAEVVQQRGALTHGLWQRAGKTNVA